MDMFKTGRAVRPIRAIRAFDPRWQSAPSAPAGHARGYSIGTFRANFLGADLMLELRKSLKLGKSSPFAPAVRACRPRLPSVPSAPAFAPSIRAFHATLQ